MLLGYVRTDAEVPGQFEPRGFRLERPTIRFHDIVWPEQGMTRGIICPGERPLMLQVETSHIGGERELRV